MNHTQPTEPTTGNKWLSVAQASAALNVSDRTIKRRIEAGEIESKLEKLPRGGVRRLVLIEDRAGHERDKTERDVRDTKGTTARDTDERKNESERDNREGRAGQIVRDTSGTNGEVELLRATVERDREEIKFLRGLVEQRDRDAAEMRAALRKALEAQPRQLTVGTPESPQIDRKSTETTPMGNHGREASNGPEIAPEPPETTTYGALADWLERELNK